MLLIWLFRREPMVPDALITKTRDILITRTPLQGIASPIYLDPLIMAQTPTKWPLAIVEKVHPGKDGKVRVVTVCTSKGTDTHPVTKLVPLINDDSRSLLASSRVPTTPGEAKQL